MENKTLKLKIESTNNLTNLDPQISQPAPLYPPPAAGSGHGLVLGSASVLPDPHTHPTSGYPPAGYPPSGYPPAGYPPSGYPPAGYPPSGYPPAGYPPSGYPPAGYPPSGYPPSGYPPAGYPPSGYPPAGYPQSGYPPPVYPLYSPQAYPPPVYQWTNFGNGIKAGLLGYELGGDNLTNIGNMISGASAFPFN